MQRELPKTPRVIAAIVIAAACLIIWFLVNSGPKHGLHWHQVGELTGGPAMDFVQVDASSAKDGTVYQDALTVLCGPAHDGCFNVAFFLPGDVIPPTEDRTVFMNNGGWIPYPTVAFWFSNEFNTWDCARAGAEAAPLNALCGKDVAKQYDAVLTLAGRVGFTKGCGLPPTDDQVIVYAFISKVGDRNRQTQLSDAYAKSLSSSSGGPDDLSRCKELGAKNEAEAVEARKTLSKP